MSAELAVVEGTLDEPQGALSYVSCDHPGDLKPIAQALELPIVAVVSCRTLDAESLHLPRLPEGADAVLLDELPDGSFRVNGRVSIDDVNEALDVKLPQEEWDTVGGLVFNTLGHVPEEDECLTVDGLEFCAERIQGRRIVSVIITRLAPPRTGAQAAAEHRD